MTDSNGVDVFDTVTNNFIINIPVIGGTEVVIGSAKTTPTINWPTPANITYGTPLNSTQLDAQAYDPTTGNPINGIYVYTNATGTVENIGNLLPTGLNQAVTATFTPTDSTDYTSATKTVDISVLSGFLPDPNGYYFQNPTPPAKLSPEYFINYYYVSPYYTSKYFF